MRRDLVALGLLAVFVGLAGCASVLGPGEPDRDRLNENASYDWDANATVALELERSVVRAVYDVSDRDTLATYRRDELGRERGLDLSALRYRYPNGTTLDVDDSRLSVERTRERTTVSFPNVTGARVGFTAPRHGKVYTTPVFVEGSYAVTLPPSARVGVPFLSQVRPGGYSTSVAGESMTLRWSDLSTSRLSVRWYLQRDLLLFSGVVAIAVAAASGGVVYYIRQIRVLERRREEVGLDVETEEDDDPRDRGPPPGMR